MPFQQYAKYVGSQGKNINTLVTEMRLDSDSDTPKLTFKPVRFLTRPEWEAAKVAGESPAARAAVVQTPALKKKATPAALPKAAPAAVESDDAEVEEPKKRASNKSAEVAPKKDFTDVISSWADD